MSVDDNWGEAIRKSTEEETPGDKSETRFKVRITNPDDVGGSVVSNPKVYNVTTSATAGIELSQALDVDTKRFLIKTKEFQSLKVGFASGESTAGPYLSVPAGANYTEEGLDLPSGLTLYFNTPNAGSIGVEILQWT